MKSKLRIACAALLATAATQAMALQLGQIQVKSALNQPLVAAIPLHPKNLTELEGLTVALAPAADFQRAGLKVSPTDQMLRFHVVTDNNGQKLILVTSSQPITDPYLDFLVQVNTRQGRQVREFVVLLNPVIAAPAPAVQAAPVATKPVQQTPSPPPPQSQPQSQSLEFPPPLSTPKKKAPPSAPKPAGAAPTLQSQAKPQPAPVKPQPKPAPAPKPVAQPASQPASAPAQATIPVNHGDTLYVIAKEHTNGNRGNINRMMLALKAANPDAFFKDNIDNLKAGAILRIPTRDQIDKISIAEANAEVHRQYQEWRAAKPHPATELAGSAARAAARSAPKPGNAAPASDHLSLTPPTGKAGGANNRAGVAGGTGSETVAGLRQQLQNDRGSLISLNQSNADLASRVQSLKAISGKSDKLLSLKDATIAELQQKLAQVQAGKPGAAAATAESTAAATASASPAMAATKAAASASGATHATAAKKASAKPTAQPLRGVEQPWYLRPVSWIVAGLIVLALILAAVFTRKRRPDASTPRGPLPDPDDVSGSGEETLPGPEPASDEDALYAQLAEHPGDLQAHLQLCRLFYSRNDVDHFVEAAEAMHEEVTDPQCAQWCEVLVMGETLAPQHPLFAPQAEVAPAEDPYGLTTLQQPTDTDDATVVRTPAAVDDPAVPVDEPHDAMPPSPEIPEPAPAMPVAAADEPAFSDDPVDTKLDLARAYLDMGDPVGARAMLDEVIEEGSQTQKDEAKRLMAEAGASDD